MTVEAPYCLCCSQRTSVPHSHPMWLDVGVFPPQIREYTGACACNQDAALRTALRAMFDGVVTAQASTQGERQ